MVLNTESLSGIEFKNIEAFSVREESLNYSFDFDSMETVLVHEVHLKIGIGDSNLKTFSITKEEYAHWQPLYMDWKNGS